MPPPRSNAGNIAMRFSRACLVALLLAFGFAAVCTMGCANAHAASLDEAITHFTADDFDETIAGISQSPHRRRIFPRCVFPH